MKRRLRRGRMQNGWSYVIVMRQLADDLAKVADRPLRPLLAARIIGLRRLVKQALHSATGTAPKVPKALRQNSPALDQDLTVITSAVAGELGTTLVSLLAHDQSAVGSIHRHICVYICREMTQATWHELGRFFGRQHHATCINAWTQISNRAQGSREFSRMLGQIMQVASVARQKKSS